MSLRQQRHTNPHRKQQPCGRGLHGVGTEIGGYKTAYEKPDFRIKEFVCYRKWEYSDTCSRYMNDKQITQP
jgi:hypothetical protein